MNKIITLGQLSDFQQDSVYGWGGVCPTLKARDYKDAVKIMIEVNELGHIEHGTGKHQSNTVYGTDGMIPAITTIDGGGTQQIKIMEDKGVKVIGRMDNSDGTLEHMNRVYDTAGCEAWRTTCGGGGLEPKIIDDTYENREPRAYADVAPSVRAEREGFKVCAMRGRNPDNPTSRQAGLPLEQMIELAEQGDISNTITSVYKDNMLLEPVAIDEQNNCIREDTVGCLTTDGSSPKHNNRILIRQATEQGYIECEPGGIADLSFPDSKDRRARVQEGGRCSPALTCGGIAGLHRMESRYRIRKLTAKECFRLMAFTDEEYDRAASVNSQSQLYKEAGNSIVVDVLSALFTEVVNALGTQKDHAGEQYDMFDLLGE